MSNIPYIETVNGYTFFLEGNPISVDSNDLRYVDVSNALKNNDMEELRSILRDNKEAYLLSKIKTDVQYFSDLKFTIVENTVNGINEVISAEVEYKGQKLPEVLKNKLLDLYKAGTKDFSHLFKFIDNLLANPDENSREQLYAFLVHENMPITADGTFIAYKAVQSDFYSITGNTKTVILEGKVNEKGQILNEIGTTIRMRHDDVENNPSVGCSHGLHVGSFKYADDFKGGSGRMIAVEVNPKDVVSVPYDCGCQKCRVSAYKVLNEVTTHFKSLTASVDENNNVCESDLLKSEYIQGQVNFETMFINTIIYLLDTADFFDTKSKIKEYLDGEAKGKKLFINKKSPDMVWSSIGKDNPEDYIMLKNAAIVVSPVMSNLAEFAAEMLYKLHETIDAYKGPHKPIWRKQLNSWYEEVSDEYDDEEDEEVSYDDLIEYISDEILAETDCGSWRRVLLHLGYDVQMVGEKNDICIYQL